MKPAGIPARMSGAQGIAAGAAGRRAQVSVTAVLKEDP